MQFNESYKRPYRPEACFLFFKSSSAVEGFQEECRKSMEIVGFSRFSGGFLMRRREKIVRIKLGQMKGFIDIYRVVTYTRRQFCDSRILYEGRVVSFYKRPLVGVIEI